MRRIRMCGSRERHNSRRGTFGFSLFCPAPDEQAKRADSLCTIGPSDRGNATTCPLTSSIPHLRISPMRPTSFSLSEAFTL